MISARVPLGELVLLFDLDTDMGIKFSSLLFRLIQNISTDQMQLLQLFELIKLCSMIVQTFLCLLCEEVKKKVTPYVATSLMLMCKHTSQISYTICANDKHLICIDSYQNYLHKLMSNTYV